MAIPCSESPMVSDQRNFIREMPSPRNASFIPPVSRSPFVTPQAPSMPIVSPRSAPPSASPMKGQFQGPTGTPKTAGPMLSAVPAGFKAGTSKTPAAAAPLPAKSARKEKGKPSVFFRSYLFLFLFCLF